MRDMDQECPIQHKTSLVFLLSVAASALYPLGIPALLFALLWIYHIPRMAAKKVVALPPRPALSARELQAACMS